MLINDIGGITKFNVFAETEEDGQSANSASSEELKQSDVKSERKTI